MSDEIVTATQTGDSIPVSSTGGTPSTITTEGVAQDKGVVSGSPATSSDSPSGAAAPESTSTPELDVDPTVGVEPELAAKPGFQSLRSSYQQRVQQVKDLQAKVQELESGQVDSYIKIDAPVEDWGIGDQLDQIQQSLPPYYNKMAWMMMERHLPDVLPVMLENANQLPPEFRPLVEASATAILQSYTGLEPEEIGAAIRMYKDQKSGLPGFSSMTATGSSNSIVPNSNQSNPVQDLSQIALQYGLDPSNQGHLQLLTQIQAQQRELAGMKESISSLSQGEQNRLVQVGEQKVGEQIGTLKNNLFAKLDLPPGYEDEKSDMEQRVMFAFDQDPVVQAAKSNLLKFYKQGTPDLKAAAGELTKLQTRLSYHYKTITEPRIARVKEFERLKSQATQQQQQQKHIPGATGATPPSSNPAPTFQGPITPEKTVELAMERYRASKVAKPF